MKYIIETINRTIFLTCALALLALSLTSAPDVRADQSLANIATGTRPTAVAVNPVTNRTYIANRDSNTVTVINGADVSATTTVNVGTFPIAIAVNAETNQIYVVNQNSNDVTVINGADNSTQTISVGTFPVAVTLNSETNQVYVVNQTSKTVTVINGADNSTNTVALPQTGFFIPVSVAVNPVTNRIYVGNSRSGGLTVIDGADNSTQTIGVRESQYTIAINPATNKIYAVSLEGVINVIKADNGNQVRTLLAIGTWPENFPSVAVNPATNRIYVVSGNDGGNSGMVVVNGADDSQQVVRFAGNDPNSRIDSVAVNAATNKIYLTDVAYNVVRVVNGADNSKISTTFATGAQPRSLAVNPVTNRIYVGNSGGASATVIDGSNLRSTYSDAVQSIAVGNAPVAVTVNEITNRAYVANRDGNNVVLIDGANNNATSFFAAGTSPVAVAVNPILNRVYVANQGSNNVTVIDGAINTGGSGSTQTVSVGTAPSALAVNAVTSRVYVANRDSNNVTVIDPANGNAAAVIAAGVRPVAVAVNSETNRIYVVNQSSSTVTVISGADNSTQTITVGTNPNSVAVNSITNRIYVSSISGVTVINGANNSIVATVAGSNFNNVAVNSTINQIYATTLNGVLLRINGDDNTAQSFNAPDIIISLAINAATNKVYLVGDGLVQFDAATNKFLGISLGGIPAQVAVNTRTNQVFVANELLNSVNLVTPINPSAVPLVTSITPSGFSNNTTISNTPTFSFTATSGYAPNASAPRNIYYQIGTQQGQWSRATPTGSTATALTATGTAPFLSNGLHTIYFFATDATSSTSINALAGSQITGQIGSYQFLVNPSLVPPAESASVSGNVLTPQGKGLRNARVTLTDQQGNAQTVMTAAQGYFRFDGVATGETYTIAVTPNRYEFEPQVVIVNEDITDLIFTANPRN